MTDLGSYNNAFDTRFEILFKHICISLRIARSHPDIPRDWRWLLQFIFIHGFYSVMIVMIAVCTYLYDFKKGDVTQICANGVLIIIYLIVTFSCYLLALYQQVFISMIKKIDNDYQLAKNYAIDEQSIVLKFINKGKHVVKIWLVISVVTSGIFPVKSWVLMIYYTILGKFKFVHFYDMTYPDAIEERKNTLMIFLILYVAFACFDYYSCFVIFGFSPVGPILSLHACGQIEIVTNRISNLFKGNDTELEIETKLKNIIRFLQEVYSFVENIQEIFKLIYEIQLKGAVIVMPVALYQILEAFKHGELGVEFISIFIGGMALSSIPCYYCDVLMESGEKMRLAVYSCGWELHWNKKTSTLLRMLLLRTSRPLVVRMFFKQVCLETLADVYHQAYAVFNVLHAMFN